MTTQAVDQTISPRDQMFSNTGHYFEVGRSALDTIRLAIQLSGVEPYRILDLPSGHGRVLRWLRAEYPGAQITASDLNRDAVDFCAETFGAVPLYSDVDPEAIALERYNITWVGSLVTHLDAPMWERFLSVLSKRTGVLIFTTAGRGFSGKDCALHAGSRTDAFLASYAATGFAFVEDSDRAGYGFARASPAWVLALLNRLSLGVIHFAESAWAAQQDVYVVRRDPPPFPRARPGSAVSDERRDDTPGRS